jgi:hypothetical protein
MTRPTKLSAEVKGNIIRNARMLLKPALNEKLDDEQVWSLFDDYTLSDKTTTFQRWCERYTDG